MKALTLTQPWATLVAIGAKSIETRSWGTSYRGLVAIHAAKGFPKDARCLCPLPPFGEALGVEILHTGKILAVAELTQCFRFDAGSESKIRHRSGLNLLPPSEADFGDYGAGRYGFVLRNVMRIDPPIPMRGMLGLWSVPAEIEQAVARQPA